MDAKFEVSRKVFTNSRIRSAIAGGRIELARHPSIPYRTISISLSFLLRHAQFLFLAILIETGAMSPSPPVPNKRARGSYAKFICFACRERRIKCALPENVTIHPSSDPQPPETSCRRCQQQGLDCIVRKTTLGRPNQKRARSSTPPTAQDANVSSRSPSPAVEDFVLLNLDREAEKKPTPDILTPSSTATNLVPTSAQLMEAIGKTFDMTSTLIARDRRFGRLGMGLQDVAPTPIQDVRSLITANKRGSLVWQRLYWPNLPSLVKLHREAKQVDPNSNLGTATILLLALLCSIALDVPTESVELTSERHLQSSLRTIIFHYGQRLMFSLPRHDYTLACLELMMAYRPLALMSSQQAAAQCLNGPLLPNLIKMAAQRLGLDYAPTRLRACLQSGAQTTDIKGLVLDTLRWTRCLMRDLYDDLGVDRSITSLRPSSGPLKEALDAVADAIEMGRAPEEVLLPYHIRRTHADGLLLVRLMASDWQNLPKLASHIHQLNETQQRRKADLDRHLQSYYGNQAREKSLALSQLYVMDQGVAQADAIGLACFLAVMSTSLAASTAGPNFDLNKYYTECVNAEVAGKDWNDDLSRQSGVRSFLELFGDPHIEALEKRLTDFINVATDLRLHGIPFVGPSSETAEDVMMACKMIVENNAVRIKIDGKLSIRIDVQLILFQEAARRLEAMEAGGDSSDAVARGSVFAASAKLIRSLHKILWTWKRSYSIEAPAQDMQSRQANINLPSVPVSQQETFTQMYAPPVGTDDYFADGIFTDWTNWPQLDAAELTNMFNFDFDTTNI